MREQPFSQSQLLNFLHEHCKMRAFRLNAELGFKFDAVLVGPDLLNIVVVETTKDATLKTLKEVGRKIQSFAWSLYAQQKHNLVTLILVVPEIPSPRDFRRALGGLNGSARVFLLSESMSGDEMRTGLKPLAAPKFTMSAKEAVGMEQLQNLLKGIEATEILALTKSSSSEIELQSKLIERLEQLASEVNHALKKS